MQVGAVIYGNKKLLCIAYRKLEEPLFVPCFKISILKFPMITFCLYFLYLSVSFLKCSILMSPKGSMRGCLYEQPTSTV